MFICSLRAMASAALMVWRKAGVPPSSRASMSSTKLCCPQGFVQLTVPPPGWSGTLFLYRVELNMSTPVVPGPPRNLWGEKKIASRLAWGRLAGCMSMGTYGAEQAKSTKQYPPYWCISSAMS